MVRNTHKSFLAGIIMTSGLIVPALASAYVGPGAGITMLGALWALVVTVAVAVGAVLFYPIRMLIKKRKAKKTADQVQA